MSLPAVERLTDYAGCHLREILSVLGLAFARVIASPQQLLYNLPCYIDSVTKEPITQL